MNEKESPGQEVHAGPGSKWAIVGAGITVLGLSSASIYVTMAEIGPVPWLIDKQVQWFDGGHYPKLTFAVVFVFLGVGLLIVACVAEWIFHKLWPKS
jgi:hypothetical protein